MEENNRRPNRRIYACGEDANMQRRQSSTSEFAEAGRVTGRNIDGYAIKIYTTYIGF